ncbi:hypothetical protein B0H13DRAFT_1907174 [Mycena leptocephala]|nr:hypothetical protein B0H13DRAFT_1907174 [Mycena leptocephala]
MAPQVVSSSDSESDSGQLAPAPVPQKSRRQHDDLSGNPTLPTRTRTTATRKPSEKVSMTDKENLAAAKARLEAQEKSLLKLRRKVATLAAPLTDQNDAARGDDEYESEERDFDGLNLRFMSSVPPCASPKKARLPRHRDILARFQKSPELGPDQRNRSSPLPADGNDDRDGDDDDVDKEDNGLMDSPQSAGEKRQHRGPVSSPAPPAKRPKTKVKEPKFREGFVVVPGVKPKAADYAPIEEAIILRAYGEYSARVVGLGGFPGTSVQYQWAEECFNNACRSANERYKSTDRVIKLITKRGSQIRGKVVDSFRPLFPTHYGFQRGSSKAIIAANRDRAAALLKKAAFHYKDTETRSGYAENAIIPAARTQIIFKDKKSLAAIFPSYFNPIPAAYLALEFSVLQSLTQEWSTGTFIQAGFTEKEMGESYRTHLSDINDKWIKCNPTVTEKLRRKWYKRASQHFCPAEPEQSTHIDEEDQDALRLELEGRTGETDTENEGAMES